MDTETKIVNQKLQELIAISDKVSPTPEMIDELKSVQGDEDDRKIDFPKCSADGLTESVGFLFLEDEHLSHVENELGIDGAPPLSNQTANQSAASTTTPEQQKIKNSAQSLDALTSIYKFFDFLEHPLISQLGDAATSATGNAVGVPVQDNNMAQFGTNIYIGPNGAANIPPPGSPEFNSFMERMISGQGTVPAGGQ